MWRRFHLVLMIVIGIAVVAITQFVVRPRFVEIIQERNQHAQERDAERSARHQAEQILAQTRSALTAVTEEIEHHRLQVVQASNHLTLVQQDLRSTHERLDQSLSEARRSAQKLARWEALGLSIEEILTMRGRMVALQEEAESLRAQHVSASAKLSLYEDRFGRFDPPPVDLRGRIVTVDPKWKFVVIELHHGQAAKRDWELLVARQGQLVAKVRVVSVDGPRSIANPVPGWDFASIQEGDLVLPGAPERHFGR